MRRLRSLPVAARARLRAPAALPLLPGPLARGTPPPQGWAAALSAGPVAQGGWDNVFVDMGASVPVATGFVTLCGAAAYAYSLIAKRDVGMKALEEKMAALEGKMSEKVSGLEGKLGKEMGGLASTLTEKVSGLEGKLSEKANGLEGKLGKEMSGLASMLSEKMNGLEGKLSEKANGLEGKLGKEMSGMVTNARSEAKAAALGVMKDYKVAVTAGGAARKP